MDRNFITIVGQRHYHYMEPFRVGSIVKLVKEYDNLCDSRAIRVETPDSDTVGYVANSNHTVFDGTDSASSVYDKMGDFAFAKVQFITHSSVIAHIMSPDDVY